MNTFSNSPDHICVGHISWGAIFAGVVSALAIASLLNFLGMSLGLMNFDLNTETIKNLSIETVFWLSISSVISMFAGGWVSGFLAGNLENPIENILHGFLTWGLSAVLAIFISATAAGVIVGGAVGFAENAFSNAGKGLAEVSSTVAPQIKNIVKSVAPQDSQFIKDVNKQAQEIFTQAKKLAQDKLSGEPGDSSLLKENLNAVNEKFTEAAGKFFKVVGSDKQDKAKEAVITVLVEQGNLSESKATDLVSSWADRYQKLKEKAQDKLDQAKTYGKDVVEETNDVLIKLSWLGFLTLLLGAVAGCIGASLATQKRE